MIGILGSGFGLYGYLPAIIQSTDERVVLLSKAAEVFNKRPELQFCKERIVWAADEVALIGMIDSLTLSLPPQVQAERIRKYSSVDHIRNMMLEKPIGPNPLVSATLLDSMIKQKKNFRVGYLFAYTDWARALIDEVSTKRRPIDSISVTWSFRAHHYKHDLHNWKRYHSSGGSVIRFFGIHLIALASTLGYTTVVRSASLGFSNDEYYKWTASLAGSDLPTMDIVIDSNSSQERFEVKTNQAGSSDGQNLYRIGMSDPFQGDKQTSDDRRVEILSILMKRLTSGEDLAKLYAGYRAINDLWAQIETSNEHTIG